MYVISRFPSSIIHCVFTISWQVLKNLPHKNKGQRKEDDNTVEEKKDKISAGLKVPKLDAEIKVDGKEEGNEEHHPHTTVYWDQPRRLVNVFFVIRFYSDFPFSAFLHKPCP